jgi:hypothetical protein
VVDVGQPDAVLLELSNAARGFEKGGGVPIVTGRLVADIVDALMDSGPLELGVSPRRWLRATTRTHQLLARLRGPDADSTAIAKRALGRLRRLFMHAAFSARWRSALGGIAWWPFVLFALVALPLFVAASIATGYPFAGLLAVWFAFLICSGRLWRTREASVARAIGARLAPDERLLLNCRMEDGLMAVATDRRLFVVTVRRHTEPKELETVSFADVITYEEGTLFGDRCVTLKTAHDALAIEFRKWGGSDDGYAYQKHHQKALVAILARRVNNRPSSTRTAVDGVPG